MAIAVWAGAATVSAAWAAGPEMPGAVARTGEPPPGPVREPYWGTVLFEVYQDNTFSALTGLMAWQHFQRLPQHAEEAEVLRGGLLLDYGLDAEAGRIFTSVINRQTTARTRDRAWFYLARLQFRKGLMAEAQTSITQSGPALPAELQDERLLLRAQLQLAQADHLGAAQTLQSMPAGSPLRPYAQFNLGVALLQAGQAAAGRQALQALGQLPAEGEELRSLRDRANLALGFDALREGDAKSAHGALERVRLAGPQSNAALLGFGWAALQRADTRLALAAFRELAQRPAQDAAVLESQLAQAHVTAQAGAPAAALSLYQAALKAYQAEHTALDAAIARTRGGDWLDALGGGQTPGRMGAAAKLNIQPQTPYAAYLTPMLAEHAVQQALRNWGDLRYAAARLSEWAQQLTVHEEMLAERASTFASRLPNVLAGAALTDQAVASQTQTAPQQQTAQKAEQWAEQWAEQKAAHQTAPQAGNDVLPGLRIEWEQAALQADGLAYADPREAGLQQRLTRAQSALSGLDGLGGLGGPDGLEAPDRQRVAERLRLANGALHWHLARQHHVRQAAAAVALAQALQAREQAQQRHQAIAAAQHGEPLRLHGFAQRIADIRQRVAVLSPRLAVLAAEQQSAAQALAEAALTRQQARLKDYTEQAHWAVAQLSDSGYVASAPKADRANPGAPHAPR